MMRVAKHALGAMIALAVVGGAVLASGCGSILGIGDTTLDLPDAAVAGVDGGTPGSDAPHMGDAGLPDAVLIDAPLAVDAEVIDTPIEPPADVLAAPDATAKDAAVEGPPDASAGGRPDATPDATLDATIDGPPDATPSDAALDAATCGWPYTTSNVDPCNLPMTNGPLTIADSFILDTDTGLVTTPSSSATLVSTSVAQIGGPNLRIIVFDELIVETTGSLQITGSQALAIVVQGSVLINSGTIDASAYTRGGTTVQVAGPGADDPVACSAGAGTAGQMAPISEEGGSGGSGGAFGTASGGGGAGTLQPSGAGGAANPSGNPTSSPLRGGCGGGAGGTTVLSLVTAQGGPGGGAFQISARASLSITGASTLRASGAGGAGAAMANNQGGGGGGGGSGGAILLEANGITITGPSNDAGPGLAICANGGAGGEGASSGTGASGQEGSCSTTTTAVDVGTQNFGGDGGAGGYVVAGPTAGGPGSPHEVDNGMFTIYGGGGGGGGSVGRIRIHDASVGSPTITNAQISPNPSLN